MIDGYVPHPLSSHEAAARWAHDDLAELALDELREEQALALVERARARHEGRHADYAWLRERSAAIVAQLAQHQAPRPGSPTTRRTAR